MGYCYLYLYFLVLLAFLVSVKSQTQRGTCYSDESCGGTSTGLVDDVTAHCCNYPSFGTQPRGFSYTLQGSEECLVCPKVFGFFDTTFSQEEASTAYSLPIGYLSGAPPNNFVTVYVTVTGTSAGTNDFTLTGADTDGVAMVGLANRQSSATVSVQHTIDGIAQENDEQYTIALSNQFNLQDFTFVNATVTIIDTDNARFFFSEADHSKNEGSKNLIISASLSKNSDTRLANPVTFTIFPITIAEAIRRGMAIPQGARLTFERNSPYEAIEADFNTTSFNVIFPADEGRGIITSIDVNVSIVDDDINERFEQLFLIGVDVADAVNPSTVDTTERNVTIGIIVDNDALVIGFNQSSLTFDEPDLFLREQINLVKENNRPTEQTFHITINLLQSTGDIRPATRPIDFIVDFFEMGDTTERDLFPTEDAVPFVLTVRSDDIPEGNEGFILDTSPSREPRYTTPSPASSVFKTLTIVIRDNDPIIIGFEESLYRVNESATVDVCIAVTIPPVNIDFSITGSLIITGTPVLNTANSSDFTPTSLFYFVSSSGANNPLSRRFCNTIQAVADGIVESVEDFTFEIDFMNPPVDRIILQPNTTKVEIVDQDVSGLRVNDTVIGDPLYTVPISVPEEQLDALNLTKLSLCFEVHGKSEQWFNLVTDDCVSVNTRYASLTPNLNIMDAVAVRAVDEANQCVNIRVDVGGCSATVGSSSLGVMNKYESDGIMVKRYSNRVRISVPNCQDLTLVMWVICENRTLEDSGSILHSNMIKFVIMRGLNFGSRQAHGLLGQFWNIPVNIAPYNGLLYDGSPTTGRYIINITANGMTRAYTGSIHGTTWDLSQGPCLYVGNKQSGPIFEVKDPNDPVIESLYTSYEVKEPFVEDEDYKFGMFDESKCNAPITLQ